MPKSVLELFSQKEVLNYLKERKFPALMGEELFPETKKKAKDKQKTTCQETRNPGRIEKSQRQGCKRN